MAVMLGFLTLPIDLTSPPVEERRGSRKAPLKEAWQTIFIRVQSRPARARGLKLYRDGITLSRRVAPRAGAWVETTPR